MFHHPYVLEYIQYMQFILPSLDVSFSGMLPKLSICRDLQLFRPGLGLGPALGYNKLN